MLKNFILFLSLLAVTFNAQAGSSSEPEKISTNIYFNRVILNQTAVDYLKRKLQGEIPQGRYWYDHLSGAWGLENGPTAGFVVAHLDLPGPMPEDISGGKTGIFINGREIHFEDQQGLQRLFGVTYQGRYWLDAQGNMGVEGSAAIVNLFTAMQQAQTQSTGGGSVMHGYGTTGERGTLSGSIYSGTTSSGKSVFWYPGM